MPLPELPESFTQADLDALMAECPEVRCPMCGRRDDLRIVGTPFALPGWYDADEKLPLVVVGCWECGCVTMFMPRAIRLSKARRGVGDGAG